MAEKSSKSNSHWVFWLVMSELIIIMFLLPVRTFEWLVDTERRVAQSSAGQEVTAWAEQVGAGWYDVAFEHTGIREQVRLHLIPTEEQRLRSKGMENLGGKWLWTYADTRIGIFFGMLEQVMVRTAMVLAWTPFAVAVTIPAVWDGLMQWRIRQYTFDFASPVVHGAGMRVVKYVFPALFLVLILPLPMPILVIPAIAVAMALGLAWIAKHTQKRI